MSDIAYPVGNSLYLNITNRCTNECSFCIRNKTRQFNKQYQLWLEHEPSLDEIMQAIGDPTKYEQIVFCGYGEPLIRLETVKALAKKLKAQGKKIRLDTNGQGNLFWGRNILPELKGLIDMISISLDAETAEVYDRLCRSLYGPKAFAAVINFIKKAKKYISEVEASVVDLPAVDKSAAQHLAQNLGVKFRVRPYYEETYVR